MIEKERESMRHGSWAWGRSQEGERDGEIRGGRVGEDVERGGNDWTVRVRDKVE